MADDPGNTLVAGPPLRVAGGAAVSGGGEARKPAVAAAVRWLATATTRDLQSVGGLSASEALEVSHHGRRLAQSLGIQLPEDAHG